MGQQGLDKAQELEDELGLGEPGVLGGGLALEEVVGAKVVLDLEEPGEPEGDSVGPAMLNFGEGEEGGEDLAGRIDC